MTRWEGDPPGDESDSDTDSQESGSDSPPLSEVNLFLLPRPVSWPCAVLENFASNQQETQEQQQQQLQQQTQQQQQRKEQQQQDDNNQQLHEFWRDQSGLHINVKELCAAFTGILVFRSGQNSNSNAILLSSCGGNCTSPRWFMFCQLPSAPSCRLT